MQFICVVWFNEFFFVFISVLTHKVCHSVKIMMEGDRTKVVDKLENAALYLPHMLHQSVLSREYFVALRTREGFQLMLLGELF